jgi:putative endonuclease
MSFRTRGLKSLCETRKSSPAGTTEFGPGRSPISANLFECFFVKQGTLEGFTAACGCKRLLYFKGYEGIRTALARGKQRKGWRREKKLNLIGTINPEFKDLAQTWGWTMITVHEKMYP